MPQSERSETIKQFLKWLNAKSKQSGASRQECINHMHIEITNMGAEPKRCEIYLRDCLQCKLIEEKDYKFSITKDGQSWIRRKTSSLSLD